MTDALATLRSCTPAGTPPLRVMVSVGGKRTPLSARTARALIQAEQAAARWNALRSDE